MLRLPNSPPYHRMSLSFPKTDATVHRLENGLEIILREDRTAPVVSVQAWVRTGSLYESRLLGAGVSHLVEHMVFKGAGHRGPTELAQAVQATGGYLNAYTSFDRTVYWVDTLAEGFDTALDVVAALTTEAVFPQDEYEREKDVIRREMDMGRDDPGRTLSQLMFSTVFRQHPYREPVIGHRELFDLITHEEALSYYRERYIPNRIFLVIAGDIRKEEALAAVQQRLGAKQNRHGAPVLLPEEPAQTARRDVHHEFAAELSKMEMAWRIPDLLHPDTPALEVLGVLLGQGRSSRLYREVRDRRGLVHEISAGAYTPTQGGIFYVGCETDPDKRTAAESAILEQIQIVQDRGVSAEEVAKARRMFLADQLCSLTTTRGQASDLGSNWISAGNLDFTRDYLEAIDRVTPGEVQNVARTYLLERSLSCVSLNPKGSLTSARTTAAAHRAPEVQRHVFPNGLTLLVREDARLPIVHFHSILRGGTLAETDATAGLNRLLARCMIRGAGPHGAEEIMDAIESVGGSIGADSGGGSYSLSAGVLTPDLRLGLDLWSTCLREPHFPDGKVAAERERQLAAIKSEEDHPGVIAMREVRRLIYGEHPFHLPRNGTQESVAALTADHLRAYHAARAVGGNMVCCVFGDVKFAEIRDQVGETLGRLPSGPRCLAENLPPLPASAGTLSELRKDKKQAVLMVAFPTVPLGHPDQAALQLVDEACSDMASRMFVRIREELGLAYSVGASQILGMAPGTFIFHLSTAPEQLDVAQAELLGEIRKLTGEGFAREELERARKSWSGKQAMQAQSGATLAQHLAVDELYGFGHTHRQALMEQMQRLTLGEVNDVLARQFGAAAPVIVRVLP